MLDFYFFKICLLYLSAIYQSQDVATIPLDEKVILNKLITLMEKGHSNHRNLAT